MADGKSRWIVLLNKSPKGPVSADEVRTLLETNVLRRNDLAYRVPENSSSKTTTEWKLLWQYPEFDRRGETAPAREERRQPETTEEATRKAAAEIPSDLQDIEPQQLILKSSVISFSAVGEPKNAERGIADLAAMPRRSKLRWFHATTAGTVAVIIGLYYVFFFETLQENEPPRVAAPIARVAPDPDLFPTLVESPPARALTPPSALASLNKTPSEPPRALSGTASDHGEILEEEAFLEDEEPDTESSQMLALPKKKKTRAAAKSKSFTRETASRHEDRGEDFGDDSPADSADEDPEADADEESVIPRG